MTFTSIGVDTIKMPKEKAINLSDMLSDGICFISGWETAKGELPFELANLRDAAKELNIALKKIAYP